jgi:hypothetical protein
VTREILIKYFAEIFVKYITTTKELLNLEDFLAVLLCGNCLSYIDDGIKEIFALANVS